MTVQTETSGTSGNAVKNAGPQSPDVDIRQVLKKSTSEVPLSELTKKGFKQVKVLNQSMIARLIAEAVDRVITSRAEKIGKEERDKVIRASQEQFESMARDRLQTQSQKLRDLEAKRDQAQSRVQSLEETVKDKEKEVDKLERDLSERDRKIGELEKKLEASSNESSANTEGLVKGLLERLQSPTSAQDFSNLQASIEGLTDKISRMALTGSGGGDAGIVDKDVVLERLFSRDDDREDMESNVSDVKVQERKAGGVKSTLAKLKELQKGGGKDGE